MSDAAAPAAAPASDAGSTTSTAAPAAAPAAAPVAAPAPAAAPAAAPAPAAAEPSTLLTDDPAKTTTDDAKKPADADADKAKDGEDDTAKKDDGKTGAPEQYAEFTTVDGAKSLDSETLSEFSTMAKEAGLTQEAAQKFVDLAGKMQLGNAHAYSQQLQQHVDGAAQQWVETAKADPEYGGTQFTENMAVAKQALDTFGTPELKTLLKESRLGSHPEVIRMLFKAGKAISQDGFVPGRASAAPKDAASALYPTSQ
jgi:hypothetical protein